MIQIDSAPLKRSLKIKNNLKVFANRIMYYAVEKERVMNKISCEGFSLRAGHGY